MFGNKVLKFTICIIWESTKNNSVEKTLSLTKTREVFRKVSLKSDLHWIGLLTIEISLDILILVHHSVSIPYFGSWSLSCLFWFHLPQRIARDSFTKHGMIIRAPWMTVAWHWWRCHIFQADKYWYDLNVVVWHHWKSWDVRSCFSRD